jgi:hypothetical protein
MKKIKLIFGFVCLLAIAISCTVDGIDGETSMLDSVTAPSEVLAFYNITQDNTGSVTITPNGEGAVSYDIYYGDDTTAAVNVLQGKSTTHVYKEGNYTVKIVAIGITGLKMEMTQSLVVSFKAPKNLEVVITNDLAISKKVNVTVTADYATMFDVYFGEAGNDVPVSANAGGTASYVYAQAGTYTIRVVVKSAAIQTTEKSQDIVAIAIIQPTAAAPTPPIRSAGDVTSIFSDAYTPNVTVNEWNPDWGQSTKLFNIVIAGTNMLKYVDLNYTGIVTDYGNPTNLSDKTFVHFDYWTTDATSLSFKMVNTTIASGPTKESLVSVSSIELGKWVSVNIPLSSFTTNMSAITQMLFESSKSTVFIDNLYFYKGVPESIQMPLDFESSQLTYTLGGFGGVTATRIANPDKSGSNLSNNVVKLDKASGAEVWAGASLNLDSSVNFTKGTKVSVNVWSPKVGAKILFKMEDSKSPKDGNGNASVIVEVETLTTVANGWQVLTFDLTGFPAFSTANSYDTIIIFPDFGTAGTGTSYYFDDIKQF